jgi:glycosyltransferase involved in cell wall biosynthesis
MNIQLAKKDLDEDIKISIITPVLNEVVCIEECICSVSKQSKVEIEHIIVDGGSTDGTLNVLEKYHHTALKIIKQKTPNGIYGAINEGLACARGKWILVLGADDSLIPNALIESFHYMTNNSEAYYGNVVLKSSGDSYDGFFSFRKLMYKNICHQAIFYPGIYCKQNLYSKEYKILADYEYLMRFISSNKINYIPVNIALYNDITGLSSNNTDYNFFKNKIYIIKENFPINYYYEYLSRNIILKIIRILHLDYIIKRFYKI